MKLYRLKSNRTTIVKRNGQFHKVAWSDTMEKGLDCRWMLCRWNPENVEELSKEEAKEVQLKIKAFEGRPQPRK